jgi:predicted nucleic acid-binding protein
MIVLDASAALDWILHTPVGLQVERRVYSGGESVHVPHLIDLELAQILRRLAGAGKLPADRANAALGILTDARLLRHPHYQLLPRIWQLRHNVTAYDAAYIALAESLDASLLTRDDKLAAAPGHHAKIELF